MDISTFLRPEYVVLDLRAANKDALLRDLAKCAAKALSLDAKSIAQALVAREMLGSTGMGEGIAIPHARLAGLSNAFGLLARVQPPITFDAVDGIAVDIFFLLLLPLAPHGGQLNALACVARRLRADGVAQAIRHASDSAAIYDVVTTPRQQC